MTKRDDPLTLRAALIVGAVAVVLLAIMGEPSMFWEILLAGAAGLGVLARDELRGSGAGASHEVRLAQIPTHKRPDAGALGCVMPRHVTRIRSDTRARETPHADLKF